MGKTSFDKQTQLLNSYKEQFYEKTISVLKQLKTEKEHLDDFQAI